MKRIWRDGYSWLGEDAKTVYGFSPIFSPRPRKDDLLISPMASGKEGVFRLVSTDTPSDPGDQWFAEARWVGYVGERLTDALLARVDKEVLGHHA